MKMVSVEKQEVNPEVMHFNVWRAFNLKVYKKSITQEHVVGNGNEKFIDTVSKVEKHAGKYHIEENKPINQKCIFLEKDGIKYILPVDYQKHLPINVKEYFECYLKPSDKTIWRFIELPSSVKITPTKTMSFKELVQVYNNMEHSDDMTWTFLKVQSIASKAKGAKYRLCSPPETGKNANDTILHMITNDNIKVSKPTIAKLETLFYYNQKVLPDEMTSLTSTQVREVEPFFLTIADESPTFTKHSMAQKKDMNEVDMTCSSCIFTYNDPGSLLQGSKFFDEIWQNKKAMASRYPALFLSGKVISEMPKLSMKQANAIMEEHFDYLVNISKNIVYWIENMYKELHGYDRSKCMLKSRHRINFEAVLDALDVYSDNQEEYDVWLDWINDKVTKYKDMVKNLDSVTVTTEEVI